MTNQIFFRDYVRLLRRRWRVIAAAVLVMVAAAVIYSLRQDTMYAAKTSLAVEDENRALGLLGTPVLPSTTPELRTTQAAKTVVQLEVMRRAKARLKTPRSATDLRRDIEVTPEPQSSQIVVEARDGDPRFAAELANAVAEEAADEQARRTRDQLNAAARPLKRRLRRAERDDASRIALADQVSQLEALASVARPVSVAAAATVPESPVSPKPVRNAVLGGFLGLFLGVGMAIVLSSLDRRLRDDEDIREVLDLPIVGHVPADALGHVGMELNGHEPTGRIDLEPFRILRANLEFLDVNQQVRTIAVSSALPEEGKSTVAASLAFSFALSGRRTLLLECDLRRPVLAERMGLDGTPGLSEYLVGQAQPQEVLRTIALGGQANGNEPGHEEDGPVLVCVFAGAVPANPAELLDSARFSALLAEIHDVYDIVIIDTSPLLVVADTREILPHIDGLLLCARASQTTREQILAVRAALENLPPMSTGVVVTGVKPQFGGDNGYYGYGKYGYN